MTFTDCREKGFRGPAQSYFTADSAEYIALWGIDTGGPGRSARDQWKIYVWTGTRADP